MNPEIERAVTFLLSMRGRLVLAQALKHGIDQMSKVENPHREVSNMQYLLETGALDIQ